MYKQGFSWKRITGSEQVYIGPCRFAGLILVATAAGDTVAISDAQNAIGPGLFHTFTAGAARTNEYPIFPPVHFDRGINAVLVANITEATIFYEEISDDPPTPEEMLKMIKSGY